MKNVILIHGWNTKEEFFDPDKPTASNDHWFPWLTKQLMIRGYKVDVPEMPQYDFSTYELWKKEVERFDISSESILVGHSCGAGFIIRYLSESAHKVDKVFLVAPWLGINFGHTFNEEFFKFRFDRNMVEKTNGVVLMVSDDDFDVIQQSVEVIRSNIDGIEYKNLQGKGHFTLASLGATEFPELLEEIII